MTAVLSIREAAAQPAPAEIVELARALKYDPDLIHEYVYNNIETLPQYGSLKGPLGALLDGKGTAFDQAELMVALLQQSGFSASYQIGAIQLSTDQLTNWLGTDNGCGTLGFTLGTSGFPTTLVPSSCTSVATAAQISWAWVQVTIGGTNYVFDPATKTYRRSSGLANIASVLGYSQSSFLAGAAVTGTSRMLTGLNRANVRSNLATYANNLVQYIRSNNPTVSTADIIGGKSIVPLPLGTQLRQTSLSYAVSTVPIQTVSTIPSTYRTILTLQFGSNDPSNGAFTQLSSPITFNSSDVYGHRLVVSFNGSLAPVLLMDGVAQLTGTGATPASRRLTVRTSIQHPYPGPGSCGGFADVCNNDQVRVIPPASTGTGLIYLISTGWGKVGRGMIEKHRKLLQQNAAQNPGNPSAEPVLGESLAMLGYTWLAEVSQQEDNVDQLANITTVYHHAVGIVGLKAVGTSVGPFVDLPLNSVGTIQRAGRPIQTTFSLTPIESAAFFAEAVFLSIAESGALEQTQPGAVAASTVKLIDTAIQSSTAIYDINNNAISGDDCSYYDSTIRPQLLPNYFSGDLARIDNLVGRLAPGICASPALRVIAPANGKITINQYTGVGYFQITQDGIAIGAIITGGLSGGEPTTPTTLGQLADDTATTGIPASLNYLVTVPGVTSGNAGGIVAATPVGNDPINLVTGDYLVSVTDLTVGRQNMPLGLAFQRYYDSGTRLTKGPLGNGWTHNFAITALTGSDGFEGLGTNSPINGAAAIAATFVTLDILNGVTTNAKSLSTIVIASVVQRWLMDQLTTNIVTVAQPGFTENFTKLADGSFNPPLGSATVLAFNNGAFSYTTKNQVALTFDGAGNLATWRDPAGGTMTLSYAGSPEVLTSVTNNLGRTLSFAYASGLLIRVSDDSGRGVSFSYDSASNLTGYVDPTGQATRYVYDLPGRLTQIFYPSTPTIPSVTNTYDSLDRVRTQSDANNSAWQYFLAGPRSEEVNPLGMRHVIYTTRRGKTLTEIQDLGGLGRTTTSTYDALDRLTSTTLPELNSVSYAYDTRSNVTSVTSTPKPGSSLSPLTTSYTYDPTYNKPVSVTDPRGLVTTMRYDPGTGNLIAAVADAGGAPHLNATTSFSYTGPGLPLTTTDALGVTTFNQFDRSGNLISSTRDFGAGRQNRTTRYSYTAAGDVTSVVDPNGGVTTRTYDEARRVRSVTLAAATGQPTGMLTLLSYDADGRVLRTQQFSAGVPLSGSSATYTPTGKPATTTDANGNVTTFTYDALDRAATVTDPMGRTVRYAYDALSRRTQTINLAVQATPLLQQSYTANGRLASITDANTNATSFAYDGLDRLGTATYPLGSTEAFTYDADGNVLTRKTRAGDTLTFTYDTLNRLATKTPPAPAPVVTYSYDPAGRLTGASDTSAAIAAVAPPAPNTFYATSYSYDALNRPIAVNWTPASVPTPPAAGSITFAHSYNKVNQRIAQTVSDNTWLEYPAASPTSTSYTANALNQYTAVGAVIPTYDANGNLTGDGTFTFGYDAENRLVSASGAGNTASYAYDAQGRRKSKTVNGTTTLFVTDADNREVLEYDGATGAPLRWYAYGLGANAALDQVNLAASSRTTFVPDLQGSMVATLDSGTGTFTNAAYLPYGGSASSAGTFRYTGQRIDAESGLYYYRARAYKPAWGRFTQVDPIGYQGGVNLYAYVGNDPLNFLDPFGLDKQPGFLSSALSTIGGWLNTPISEPYLIPNRPDVFSCGICLSQPLLASPTDYGQLGATVRPFTVGDAVEAGLAVGSIASMGWGRGLSALEVTAVTAAERLAINRAAGAAFESAVGSRLEQTGATIGRQVTIETQSGVRTRLDFVTRDPAGVIGCVECKASPTAPLTPNQALAFPQIGQTGGTIVGAGKPGFAGGMQIPPTNVDIIRGP